MTLCTLECSYGDTPPRENTLCSCMNTSPITDCIPPPTDPQLFIRKFPVLRRSEVGEWGWAVQVLSENMKR